MPAVAYAENAAQQWRCRRAAAAGGSARLDQDSAAAEAVCVHAGRLVCVPNAASVLGCVPPYVDRRQNCCRCEESQQTCEESQPIVIEMELAHTTTYPQTKL